MELFLNGELDAVNLSADSIEQYIEDPRVYQSPASGVNTMLINMGNTNNSRADIERLNDQIDLTAFVDEMSSLIFAFYIDFFSYFAQDIVSGINIYGEFCKKYDVRVPVIFKTKTRNQFVGSSFQPLPIKELQEALDVLKSNPHVEINIVK